MIWPVKFTILAFLSLATILSLCIIQMSLSGNGVLETKQIQQPHVSSNEFLRVNIGTGNSSVTSDTGPYNNWRNLSLEEVRNLSTLGRRLFLLQSVGDQQNRTIVIHVWKHMDNLRNRLIRRYTSNNYDPFEDCSVSNCRLTSRDDEVTEADAVLFHMHRIAGPPTDVPRLPGQLWVWMADESPYNVMMLAKDRTLAHYSGLFNWSMTYRMESDVPVPYGRTVPLTEGQGTSTRDIAKLFDQKSKNISMMISNCHGQNSRYKYVKELEKHIPVDVYGRCGPLKCPGHFSNDCPLLNDYKFYLAFENTNCDDYITEKAWWSALGKGAVPVVMGATRANYEKVLPPNSFIFVDDFETPEHLANFLRYLLDHPSEYQEYHQWRGRYRVLNEHGYFQSPVYHFCRLCEALNYNNRDGPATADLVNFFDPRQHCHATRWRPNTFL